jgi:hypothetical protein
MLLKPDEDRTYPTDQIYPMGDQNCPTRLACHNFGTLPGDQTCPTGQICPTGPGCHGTGT